jgi:putative glutamine amidotransferase
VSVNDFAQWLDGLVMHGGADVWPGSYGEQPLRPEWHGDRIRDEYEIALVKAFTAAGKPVFGICRGLQLINVAHGGTLYQDIGTQKPGALVHRDADAYDLNFHEVDIVPGSRLAELLRESRHKINSVHHQGIKDLAPGFVVEATSPDDGVIEAIRHTGGTWVAAVQWHPEFHFPQLGVVDDTPLLKDFLDAARAARNQ